MPASVSHQPCLSFGDADAYPTLMATAVALGFSLVLTHRNTRVWARVGGEFVGIRHRSIFGSREPGVPRDVVAMA